MFVILKDSILIINYQFIQNIVVHTCWTEPLNLCTHYSTIKILSTYKNVENNNLRNIM